MGTRGYYILRYRGLFYVFYSHHDSYFCGLGQELVDELRKLGEPGFEELKALIDKIPSEFARKPGEPGGYMWFRGIKHALENYATFLDRIDKERPCSPSDECDIEYQYIIVDLDNGRFELMWLDGRLPFPATQAFWLKNIPEDWQAVSNEKPGRK